MGDRSFNGGNDKRAQMQNIFTQPKLTRLFKSLLNKSSDLHHSIKECFEMVEM